MLLIIPANRFTHRLVFRIDSFGCLFSIRREDELEAWGWLWGYRPFHSIEAR